MKKFGVRFLSLCLALCMLLGSASAIDLSKFKNYEAFKKKLYEAITYDFGFHIGSILFAMRSYFRHIFRIIYNHKS